MTYVKLNPELVQVKISQISRNINFDLGLVFKMEDQEYSIVCSDVTLNRVMK
jgi:hypothetical protein